MDRIDLTPSRWLSRRRIISALVLVVATDLLLMPTTHADEPIDRGNENDDVTVELFDGKSLKNWRIIDTFDFEDHGKVYVRDKIIHLEKGKPATGISWKKELPRSNYELTMQAQRVDGSDFFCGLTFPVKKEYCTLIVGGWGGQLVGLSNIDGFSAAENSTTRVIEFKNKQWYGIRLRVTDDRISVWIDKDKIIDVVTENRKFSIWWEQEPVRPLGLVTWYTSAALKELKFKRIVDQDK